jgi:DNA-binding PadR family transcriptional regulator
MIDYAILGLLRERPDHGYRLRQRLLERLGPVWDINPGQVYLVLHALRRRGLVESVAEEPPDPLQRRQRFAITAKGERQVLRWLRRAPRLLRASRRDLELGLLLLEGSPREHVEAYLDQTLAAVEATERWLRRGSVEAPRDLVRGLSVGRALQELGAVQGWVLQARAALAQTGRPEHRRERQCGTEAQPR